MIYCHTECDAGHEPFLTTRFGDVGFMFGIFALIFATGTFLILQRTLTRIVLGPKVRVQAPPNLVDLDECRRLLGAGVDDWGGVSPLTPDHVNPERPWPSLDGLRCVLYWDGLNVRLVNRSGVDITRKFPDFEITPGINLEYAVSRVLDASSERSIRICGLRPNHASSRWRRSCQPSGLMSSRPSNSMS